MKSLGVPTTRRSRQQLPQLVLYTTGTATPARTEN
jgi:hypothetical protein